MDFKLEKFPDIIYACFVLHNFCEWYSVYINEEQVKTQTELLKTNKTQFKNLADPIFSYVEGEKEVFWKTLTDYIKENIKHLLFTALVLHRSCILKRFLHTHLFISNRFVGNWSSEVKVLSTFRNRSSCMKQQQKSVVVNVCNIASKSLR